MTSTREVDANLRAAVDSIRRAAELGAELVVLPENFGFVGPDADKLALAQTLSSSRLLTPLAAVARECSVAVLIGSLPELGPDPEHCFNTSVFIDERGEVVATYRKIHLFDVDVGPGARFQESATVASGDEPVVVQWRDWCIGLSICYDLRFPELYRRLVEQGAELLMVPAAFTLQTGKDHWRPLLEARAIENQCYLVAAGQWGSHGGGRVSWGKSMILDAWGTPLAIAPERACVITAELDKQALADVRARLPALSHRRF